jgi:hypothetical protein
MFSVAVPTHWQGEGGLSACTNLKLRTFHTIRNDDLYFLHWGDPVYARAFINGLPSPATFTEGIYIGGDGFTTTRVFHAKEGPYKNDLEINRLWYRQMIWGRMSYNPATTDQVFQNYLHLHYPEVDANALFTAWTNASRAFDVGNEFIRGPWLNDYQYYPEGQNSGSGYISANNFAGASPNPGSKLTNSIAVADSIFKMGDAALKTLNSMSPGGNAELAINLKNLKALACLSIYVGEKIRGAKNSSLRTASLQKAYCYWEKYTELMDQMHVGQQFTRVQDILPNWSSLNKNALADAGGTRPTNCPDIVGIAAPPSQTAAVGRKQSVRISALSTSAITLYLPNAEGFSLEVFSSNGAKVAELGNSRNNAGVSRFVLGKKLTEGVYMVRLKSAGQTAVQQMNVCCD